MSVTVRPAGYAASTRARPPIAGMCASSALIPCPIPSPKKTMIRIPVHTPSLVQNRSAKCIIVAPVVTVVLRLTESDMLSSDLV